MLAKSPHRQIDIVALVDAVEIKFGNRLLCHPAAFEDGLIDIGAGGQHGQLIPARSQHRTGDFTECPTQSERKTVTHGRQDDRLGFIPLWHQQADNQGNQGDGDDVDVDDLSPLNDGGQQINEIQLALIHIFHR